jgi:hypothetical protein
MGEEHSTRPADYRSPEPGMFKRIFHHPNFNVVAGLFGIIGTLSGIYFYFVSIQKPELTYYISPTRTSIVKKGNLDNLSVTFQGEAIKGDLSTAEIQVWNQGKAPIRKGDILLPITIKTPHGEPIYQTSITESRDVIGFMAIDTSPAMSGHIFLNPLILEQGDGYKVQFIYGGDVNLPLIVEGTVVGQHSIRRLMPFLKPSLGVIIFYFCMTAWTIYLIVVDRHFLFGNSQLKVVKLVKWAKWVKVFATVTYLVNYLLLLLFIYFICASMNARLSIPPFGL